MLKLCQLMLALSVLWLMLISAPLVPMVAEPVLTLLPLGRADVATEPKRCWAKDVFKVISSSAAAAAAIFKMPTKALLKRSVRTVKQFDWPLAALPDALHCSPTATNVPKRSEKMVL
jgi:hypothetical protein